MVHLRYRLENVVHCLCIADDIDDKYVPITNWGGVLCMLRDVLRITSSLSPPAPYGRAP